MKGLRRASRGSAEAVETRINVVLADVAPLLRIDHCRLELVEFTPASGELVVRIEGSWSDCVASPLTFATAIEAHVKLRVPDVRAVRIIGDA